MNMCRKTVLAVFAVVLSVMLMSFTCAASENIGEPITLLYNDNPIEGAIHVDGTPYAPYRALISAIEPEITFDWNQAKAATTASGDGIVINASVGNNYINSLFFIIFQNLKNFAKCKTRNNKFCTLK